MPIPASGPVSFANIQAEFGGNNPIGLNEYYAGGGLVPAGITGTFGAVPSSGAISVRNFYGTSNVFTFNQTIATNTNNYNLRSAAIAAGWDQVLALQATITINAGVFVGSSSTSTPAFQTGSSFPAGSTLAITNNGHIVGRGGDGGGGGPGSSGGGGGGVVNSSAGTVSSFGNVGSPGGNTTGGAGGAGRGVVSGGGGEAFLPGVAGLSGGLALLVNYSTSITNNETIGGGGGGGGSGAFSSIFMGPGQGFRIVAQPGGAGGNLGNSGVAGTSDPYPQPGGAGGAAGAATLGNALITWIVTGNRYGALN